jgi:hypothetical protein
VSGVTVEQVMQTRREGRKAEAIALIVWGRTT